MDEVWGISGQRAVAIFISLVIALAVAGPLWRGWLIRRMRLDGPVRPGLTPHHLAYLSASPLPVGGRRRAVESAVAALTHAGRLRVDGNGRLTRVGKTEPEDPFERAVFARVRPGASIAELPVEVRPALAKLSDDLAERGLALRERSVAAYRRTILVAYLVTELLGFVWMVIEMKVHPMTSMTTVERNGIVHFYSDLQFPDVAPLLLLGALMIVIWTYLCMRGKRDYITKAGRYFVLEAIASWRAGTPGPGGLGVIEGPAVVSITGIVGYPDKKVASAFVGKPVTD